MSRLLAPLLLLLSCAPVVRGPELGPDLPAPVNPNSAVVEIGPHLYGLSICVNRPVSWVQEELGHQLTRVVQEHEGSHRKTMRDKGGCAEYWKWRRASLENAMEDEASAFCAGARRAVEVGLAGSLDEAIREQALAFGGYWRIGVAQAERRIAAACGA
jgi:hypothetical protein